MNRCSTKQELRAAFAHATASGKQEGWKPTAADLLLQLQVIDGQLTFEEAVRKIAADASVKTTSIAPDDPQNFVK